MSMDPDGTNRIIKQQIKQWYAEVDEGRNAKLVAVEPGRTLRSRIAPLGGFLAGLVGRLSAFRHHAPEVTLAVTLPATDPAPGLAKGTSSR